MDINLQGNTSDISEHETLSQNPVHALEEGLVYVKKRLMEYN